MKTWCAFLEVAPVAKGRPKFCRAGKFVRAITPEKTRRAEGEIRFFISQRDPVMFEGPIAMILGFHFLKPKSAKTRVHHTVRPDADNLAKQVIDSCIGILFRDDAQIVKIEAQKVYSETQGIYIEIKEVA